MPVEINKENKRKHICLGILAHVDAGKTTLSEALLYESGSIRKLGRVDHRDAFLDTDALERERGITIFSKMAEFSTEEMDVTLLDTPFTVWDALGFAAVFAMLAVLSVGGKKYAGRLDV